MTDLDLSMTIGDGVAAKEYLLKELRAADIAITAIHLWLR